jgi:hypothetical protein
VRQAVVGLLVKVLQALVGLLVNVLQVVVGLLVNVLQAVVGLLVNVLQAVVGLLVNRPQLEALPPRQSYGNQWLQSQLNGVPDDGHNSARNMLGGVYATKQ